MEELARAAKAASRRLARMSTAEKNDVLLAAAREIRARNAELLSANAEDVRAAAGRTPAFIDRLKLDVEKTARGVEEVAALPDPVGEVRDFAKRPNGLDIKRMRVPLGVIAIIYESRPGVTADAAALCLKSGNAPILRGGKEALRTNRLLAACFPKDLVFFVDDPDREAVKRLVKLDRYIDLVIPRGGPELTRAVRAESSIAVLSHDKGVCHVYVHADADPKMAEAIALNAKVERPGVCNAMETLLIHKDFDRNPLLAALEKAGVELRVDRDFDEEFLDLILSVRVVRSLDEAIAHIEAHGTGLAEAIVTKDQAVAERFLKEVDAGAVYWNASTRFTDGGEFGLGAEMGISTQKIHARGPVALEGLTCEKFVVRGSGQVRDSKRLT